MAEPRRVLQGRVVRRRICESVPVAQLIDVRGWRAGNLHFRMIIQADDDGRFDGDPRAVKALCIPMHDVAIEEVEQDLLAMEELGLIRRYTVGNRRYGCFPSWLENQPRPNQAHYRASELPADPAIKSPSRRHRAANNSPSTRQRHANNSPRDDGDSPAVRHPYRSGPVRSGKGKEKAVDVTLPPEGMSAGNIGDVITASLEAAEGPPEEDPTAPIYSSLGSNGGGNGGPPTDADREEARREVARSLGLPEDASPEQITQATAARAGRGSPARQAKNANLAREVE